MPRKGKGGKAEGSPQTAYANRTDLNNRGPQPITVAPGEPYGQRKMLEDAQRAVPMAGVSTPTPQIQPQGSQQMQSAPQQPLVKPGELGFYDPAPHPPMPAQPSMQIPQSNAGAQRLSDLLSNAASSQYSTPQVEQLAAVARQMGI